MATIPLPSGDDSNAAQPRDGHSIRVEIPGRTLAKVVVAALITLTALWLVAKLANVLLLILVALLLATVLSKPVAWLERKGVKRGLAAVLAIVAIVLILSLVVDRMVPPLVAETRHFINEMPHIVQRLRTTLLRNPDIYTSVAQHLQELRSHPDALLARAFRLSMGALTLGFAGVLVLTLTMYFLVDAARVRAALLRLTPDAYRTRVDQTLDGMGEAVRGYFVGRTLISLLFAIFMFILLTVLGVPYAVVFATCAFFLDSIPQIGSILSAVLPVLVALSQSVTSAIIVAAAVLVFDQIESNVISPRVMSGKLNIPPVTTLIAVLAGAKLFGIIGALIAIPLAGTLPVLERIWIAPKRKPPETAQPLRAVRGPGTE